MQMLADDAGGKHVPVEEHVELVLLEDKRAELDLSGEELDLSGEEPD